MQTGQVRYLTVYGAWGTSRADYIISLEGDRDGRYDGGGGAGEGGEVEGGAGEKEEERGRQGRSACFPGGEVVPRSSASPSTQPSSDNRLLSFQFA